MRKTLKVSTFNYSRQKPQLNTAMKYSNFVIYDKNDG